MFKKNQEELELNGTHQHLVYADYVNMFGQKINTVKENTKALLDASKHCYIEINAEYMFVSHHQNARQN
jgi:methionine synthase II (cobalamin-independent)